MKKLKSNLILLFPVLTLILSIVLSGFSISAEEKYEITLELKSSTEVEVGDENVDFEIWKLEGREKDDVKEVGEELNKYSREKLNQKFGEPIRKISSKGEKNIKLSELERGMYYLRDKDYGKDRKYYSPVVFRLPEQHFSKVNMKLITTSPYRPGGSSGGGNPKNGIRFKKIADDKKKTPLKGAVFKVTYKVNGFDKTVQRNGKDYIVTSGDDGFFCVEDLEYGDYYLWEVKSPEGYRSLKNMIKFTIDANSDSDAEVIEIVNNKEEEKTPGPPTGGKTDKTPENKKVPEPEEDKKTSDNTPKKGNIPQTGDIMLLLLSIEGMVLTLIGYLLVRSERTKDKMTIL